MRHTRMLVMACLAAALAFPTAAPASSPQEAMLQKINVVRAQHGVAPLHRSGSLGASAQSYSNWLIRVDYFGHLARIRAPGLFDRLGEVLEIHRGRRPRTGRTLARWLRSPGHRYVVLSRSFRYFGAGRTVGRFQGRRRTVWVGHFGAH